MEAGYLYDAVWLYANAAHKILEAKGYASDGRAIFQELRGREYLSKFPYFRRKHGFCLFLILCGYTVNVSSRLQNSRVRMNLMGAANERFFQAIFSATV